MESPPKEGKAWALATALALPALLFPIYNPDLFWHLSAGRWMLERRALPRTDFLSFTAAGAGWLDFEWLAELIFQGIYGWGGMAGLWLLKIALLLAGWLVLNDLLKLYGIAPLHRAAGFALWSCGALPYSDLRPELFSVVFFAILLRMLEGFRLGGRHFGPRVMAGFFLLFAVWTNLHAGFAFGLALFAIYAAAELALGRWRAAARLAAGAAAGVLGSFCQPYGLGPYRVGIGHWLLRAALSRHIQEWQPFGLGNPLHWPLWLMLAGCAGLILYRAVAAAGGWKERLPWAPALAAAYFGLGMLAHGRLSAYFNATAVPLVLLLCRDSGWLGEKGRPFLRAAVLAYALYLCWLVPRVSWAGTFNYRHVPRPAAEFMDRERSALEGLRLYNVWEWGGYLGWRLHPWYRVYGDGRYIFHEELVETAEASADAAKWRDFMARRELDGALLPNLDARLPSRRRYPDGTERPFSRPWYAFYMPSDRWALVYWDAQALLFVDRRKAPAPWLARHEYRYLKPKDDAAFADALKRREIPAAKLAGEKARHARELGF